MDIETKNNIELITGIINRAIEDYICDGWWLNNNPKPTEEIGKKSCVYNNHMKNFSGSKEFFGGKTWQIYTLDDDNSLADYLICQMDKLTQLGKTVVIDGKRHRVTKGRLNLGAKILTDRVREHLNNTWH